MAEAAASSGNTWWALEAVLAEATWLEIAAPLVFLACWAGYWLAVDQLHLARRSLMRRMDEYRSAWMRQMLVRDNRMVDVQVVQVLIQNVSFFASSAILIVGPPCQQA